MTMASDSEGKLIGHLTLGEQDELADLLRLVLIASMTP
jgi:hypothetical protein